ncbi:MAG: sulfur carrier protein ThiS [bacterium ADurb.Bin270]|nr:MAG: sulfur carrier protein ThiS [bacterium ADurb.Bin270]HQG14112.1 sulfur carrier protein ThiS [bacterium]HQH80017.1 sulfur carrier protein ThiS [bacterium]
MKIVLNGNEKEVSDEILLSTLLSEIGIDEKGTAVAINGEIVPKKTFHGKKINAGDRIDLLRAIGGG